METQGYSYPILKSAAPTYIFALRLDGLNSSSENNILVGHFN